MNKQRKMMPMCLTSFSPRPLLRAVLGAALTLPLGACPPSPQITLKTVQLSPTILATGEYGLLGAVGYCFSGGNEPLTSWPPAEDNRTSQVGFDHYWQPGAQPFPCNHVNDIVFRTGVMFDLSQFSSVAGATLTFITYRSALRTNGQTTDPMIPPASFATTLGLLTQPILGPNNIPNLTMPDTNEASLVPSGPTQPPICTLASGNTRLACSVEVGSQARTWVSGSLPNYGFAIGGPTGEPDANNLAQDNDAKVSFYSNFALAVLYNPALNPRAPQ